MTAPAIIAQHQRIRDTRTAEKVAPMTIDEMKAACAKGPYVYLTTIRDDIPKGERIRLTTTGGPLGRLCTVQSAEGFRFSVTGCWESAKVLAWLEKQERAA